MEKSPSLVYGARLELVYGLIAHRGFESLLLRHDWVTKKMSPNFFLYSCGFAGFLERNPKNGFTVDVQTTKHR